MQQILFGVFVSCHCDYPKVAFFFISIAPGSHSCLLWLQLKEVCAFFLFIYLCFESSSLRCAACPFFHATSIDCCCIPFFVLLQLLFFLLAVDQFSFMFLVGIRLCPVRIHHCQHRSLFPHRFTTVRWLFLPSFVALLINSISSSLRSTDTRHSLVVMLVAPVPSSATSSQHTFPSLISLPEHSSQSWSNNSSSQRKKSTTKTTREFSARLALKA